MPKTAHKVVVIGHRNPDTDSICSAIAYAELKNKTSSLVCEARRAGRMNQETEFVLKRFGVAPPRMCTDVNPKIRDVDYREMPGIPGSTSLRKAWEIMRDQKIDTLPITSADNELEGIITVKDIATANMDVFDTGVLATSRTTYKNILETLGGTMVVGNENAVCTTGHIKIGTATLRCWKQRRKGRHRYPGPTAMRASCAPSRRKHPSSSSATAPRWAAPSSASPRRPAVAIIPAPLRHLRPPGKL